MGVTGPEELEQLLAAVELSRQPGVGAKTFKELVMKHGTPVRAMAASPQRIGSGDVSGKALLAAAQRDAISQLSPKVGFTYLGAADYPNLLAQVSEPPPYLFRVGPLWPLTGLAVAVVGPRECSQHAVVFATELAARLAARGVIVVSGGARGIDASAHEGALGTGGKTLFVTATGIDRRYPGENRLLHQQIEEGGCVLTELLPGTPPRRDFFPTRNRILVGLCHATVIIEGACKSGTASSAGHAFKLGRPIFTWCRSMEASLRELPDELVEQGAIPLAEPDARSVISAIEKWRH